MLFFFFLPFFKISLFCFPPPRGYFPRRSNYYSLKQTDSRLEDPRFSFATDNTGTEVRRWTTMTLPQRWLMDWIA